VSVDDQLLQDLIAVRARSLGVRCESADGRLTVDDDADANGRERTTTLAVVGTIDAEALDLCGRDGISAVLTPQSPAELLDLALAPRAVDGLVVDPTIAARLARRVARAEPLGANRGLTAREGEILRLMGRGLPLKQIADRLGITTKTVENHATKLYAKLGVRNRREAVARAGAGDAGA